MPAAPTATPEQIKDVNTRYHDAAAAEYDAKWGIDFGEIGQAQVAREARARRSASGPGRVRRRARDRRRHRLLLAQPAPARADRARDRDRHLAGDARRARRHRGATSGSRSTTVRAEAERLPFDDESFDLVFGHAVLHHIPDLERAFAEFERVLRPGRRRSPSAASRRATATGSRRCRSAPALLAAPALAARSSAPRQRRPRRTPTARDDGHELECEVDVHAFAPADLRRLARDAGFEDVAGHAARSCSPTPTAGSCARSRRAPSPTRSRCAWRRFAFRSYLALQRLDAALLEPRLPPELFYNLVLSGRAPADPKP